MSQDAKLLQVTLKKRPFKLSTVDGIFSVRQASEILLDMPADIS